MKKLKPRTLIIILVTTILVSIPTIYFTGKSIIETTVEYDVEERVEAAVEDFEYNQIPEEDRRLIEAEDLNLMPTQERGTLQFSKEILNDYKNKAYEKILSLNIKAADELIQEMISSFNTEEYQEEIYQFRRDINLLMMLNTDDNDSDNFLDELQVVQKIEDPVAFLVGYLTLDELDKRAITIHSRALMFNIYDLDIIEITAYPIVDLTDYYQMKSSIDFDDELSVKITVNSTLGETVEIYVDTIDNSTYLYTVESTVESTNHSILSEYIKKYK